MAALAGCAPRSRTLGCARSVIARRRLALDHPCGDLLVAGRALVELTLPARRLALPDVVRDPEGETEAALRIRSPGWPGAPFTVASRSRRSSRAACRSSATIAAPGSRAAGPGTDEPEDPGNVSSRVPREEIPDLDQLADPPVEDGEEDGLRCRGGQPVQSDDALAASRWPTASVRAQTEPGRPPRRGPERRRREIGSARDRGRACRARDPPSGSDSADRRRCRGRIRRSAARARGRCRRQVQAALARLVLDPAGQLAGFRRAEGAHLAAERLDGVDDALLAGLLRAGGVDSTNTTALPGAINGRSASSAVAILVLTVRAPTFVTTASVPPPNIDWVATRSCSWPTSAAAWLRSPRIVEPLDGPAGVGRDRVRHPPDRPARSEIVVTPEVGDRRDGHIRPACAARSAAPVQRSRWTS